MFLGHFGVGFAAKTTQPWVSLGTLFLAAQLADLLWPTLLLLGIEKVTIVPGLMAASPLDFVHYPFSHSLLMQVLGGVLLGGAYGLLRRNWRGALLVGLLVPSHWLLDLPMHRPDLPLYPGQSPLLGLGLWNHPLATLLLEFGLFGAGLRQYVRRTRPGSRAGRYGLWALVLLLALIYLGSAFGPPPASATAVAWGCQLLWLLVLLAYWTDRHREIISDTRPASAPSIA